MIRIQIQDIENQYGISNQKNNGNQSLLEKLLGLEKSIGDRMEGLDNTDDSLLSKINNLEKDNAQSLTDFKKDLDNKLTEHEKDVNGKLQVVNDKANSLVIKLNSLDTDNKNNSQTIVNLQESIYLQTDQASLVQQVLAPSQPATASIIASQINSAPNVGSSSSLSQSSFSSNNQQLNNVAVQQSQSNRVSETEN